MKGLMEAYKITKNQDKKENKLYMAIVDVLDEIAREVSELKDQQNDLEEYVEKIDDDLSNLEETMMEDEEEDFDEVECPHCGEIVCVDDAIQESSEDLICPACGKKIDLE